MTASYQSPDSTVLLTASGKAYYHAHETSVVYAGTVLDPNGKPVAKALVDFFAGSKAAAAGRVIAITDTKGAFSRKLPGGRSPDFLVASRVASGNSFKIQWYNVTVTTPTPGATTGLVLRETTPATRPATSLSSAE